MVSVQVATDVPSLPEIESANQRRAGSGADPAASNLRARLWDWPAAIAVTLDNPAGIVSWPKVFSPQATAVPSERRARLCWAPPARATVPDRPTGTLVWPEELSPHAMTWPSFFTARACVAPAAMTTALVTICGALVWPRVP